MFRKPYAPLAVALALLVCTAVALPAQSAVDDRMIVSPGMDQSCNIDVVPAATLLFPYFSVDLETGRNVTTFSVINADSEPRLARVTLWTNWALPTLSFDVYLAGYDVAVFNVAGLFTGKAFAGPAHDPDGPGPLSADNVVFPDCSSAQVVGQGIVRPLHFHPAFHADLLPPYRALMRAHQGHRVGNRYWADRTPLVWAQPDPVDAVTGYITVDVVNRCSRSFPSDRDYFVHGGRGIAGNDNVLLGEYMIYEPAGARSFGDTAVHLRADADAFAPGDYTFYGRYVDATAADGRQPLGTVFASRYITELNFAESVNTYLLVWRDTKQLPLGPMLAGMKPPWYPLGGDPMLVFDETSDLAMTRIADELPLATQSLDMDLLGTPFPYGWLMVDLNHQASELFGGAAQGWMTTLIAGEVRSAPEGIHVGSGCRAFRLESPCDYR
jgi:hypothetical protein